MQVIIFGICSRHKRIFASFLARDEISGHAVSGLNAKQETWCLRVKCKVVETCCLRVKCKVVETCCLRVECKVVEKHAV